MADIKWEKTDPEDMYSAMVGIDNEGNKWHLTGSQEVYTCTTPEGNSGQGWSVLEAYRNAKKAA